MDLVKESRLPADIIGKFSLCSEKMRSALVVVRPKLLCERNNLQRNWRRGHRRIGMNFTDAIETGFSKQGTGLNKSLNKS